MTDTNSHADYVRDVAWSPKTGASEVLVSCSEVLFIVDMRIKNFRMGLLFSGATPSPEKMILEKLITRNVKELPGESVGLLMVKLWLFQLLVQALKILLKFIE